MFTGVSFEKAIDYYRRGKEVLVLDRSSKSLAGTGYDTFGFEELFDNLDFLVDVPAVPDLEFAQAVQNMMAGGITLDSEAVVQAVNDTQEEPEEDEQAPPETPEVSEVIKEPPARKKKECDYDILKGYIESGKTDSEIAKLENVSLSVVKHWVRENGLVGIRKKGRVSRAEKEQALGHNDDRHLCRTCQYRGGNNGSMKNGCDYIEITGHSRGCSVEECTVYVRGKRIKTNERAVRNGYGEI